MLNLCKVAKSPNLRRTNQGHFLLCLLSNMTGFFYLTSDVVTPVLQLPEKKFSQIFYCVEYLVSPRVQEFFRDFSALLRFFFR